MFVNSCAGPLDRKDRLVLLDRQGLLVQLEQRDQVVRKDHGESMG